MECSYDSVTLADSSWRRMCGVSTGQLIVLCHCWRPFLHDTVLDKFPQKGLIFILCSLAEWIEYRGCISTTELKKYCKRAFASQDCWGAQEGMECHSSTGHRVQLDANPVQGTGLGTPWMECQSEAGHKAGDTRVGCQSSAGCRIADTLDRSSAGYNAGKHGMPVWHRTPWMGC